MIDQDEFKSVITAAQKRIYESTSFLASMEEKRRAWDERQAFFRRKSFSLPEAFELLGRFEAKSLEFRHVAHAMMPNDPIPLEQAISLLVAWEKITSADGFDNGLMPIARLYFTRLKEKSVVMLCDMGNVAEALYSIKDAGLSKLSGDMLRGVVKRIAVDLKPSTADLQRALNTPLLRSLTTDMMTRQVVQTLLPWTMRPLPVVPAQIIAALQQEAERGGFPASVPAKMAANDPALRQWLKHREIERADWLCLNPNGHLPNNSPKMASVFAFRDPNVAFEFKLSWR